MGLTPITDKNTFECSLGEDTDRVVIGNEAQLNKFEADVKLTRWQEENFLSFALEGFSGTPTLANDKLTLSKGKTSIEFYKATEEIFKWVWIVESKPATNEFSLKLTGYEDLVFAYQGIWTNVEEFDFFGETCVRNLDMPDTFRPLNVQGSYAVYHKTKKDKSRMNL